MTLRERIEALAREAQKAADYARGFAWGTEISRAHETYADELRRALAASPETGEGARSPVADEIERSIPVEGLSPPYRAGMEIAVRIARVFERGGLRTSTLDPPPRASTGEGERTCSGCGRTIRRDSNTNRCVDCCAPSPPTGEPLGGAAACEVYGVQVGPSTVSDSTPPPGEPCACSEGCSDCDGVDAVSPGLSPGRGTRE